MRKIICFLFILISPQSLSEVRAKELDKLVFQWSQLEQQFSEIDNRWYEKKPLIEQQLGLLKAENLQLQVLLDGHISASSDVKNKRFQLLAEQTRMEKLQEMMRRDLVQVTATVISMHNRLPPPIKTKWNTDIAILIGAKTDQSSALLSNSERLEKLLQMLANIERFEERPALHQTTMTVNIGKDSAAQVNKIIEIQVDQVYLGISQGWYISNDGKYWGSGNSTPLGWEWQHQASDVNVIDLRKTVTMLKEPSAATIVTLPVKLSKLAAINAGEI